MPPASRHNALVGKNVKRATPARPVHHLRNHTTSIPALIRSNSKRDIPRTSHLPYSHDIDTERPPLLPPPLTQSRCGMIPRPSRRSYPVELEAGDYLSVLTPLASRFRCGTTPRPSSRPYPIEIESSEPFPVPPLLFLRYRYGTSPRSSRQL